MRVSVLIIGILLASVIIIGGSAFVGDFATSYNVQGVQDLSYLNQSATVTTKIGSMNQAMARVNQSSSNPLENAWNYLGMMSSTFINVGLLLLDSPMILINIMTNNAGSGLLQLMGIPEWIIMIFTAIVLALVIFAVYRIVAKSDI